MTAEEIREYVNTAITIGLNTKIACNKKLAANGIIPDVQPLEGIKVRMLGEIAAQLAELNRHVFLEHRTYKETNLQDY